MYIRNIFVRAYVLDERVCVSFIIYSL